MLCGGGRRRIANSCGSRRDAGSRILLLVQITGNAETRLQPLTTPQCVASANVKPVAAYTLFVIDFAAVAVDTPVTARRSTVVVVVVWRTINRSWIDHWMNPLLFPLGPARPASWKRHNLPTSSDFHSSRIDLRGDDSTSTSTGSRSSWWIPSDQSKTLPSPQSDKILYLNYLLRMTLTIKVNLEGNSNSLEVKTLRCGPDK